MKNAKETLIYMIDLLTHYLTELKDVQDTPTQQFLYGEKLAYTECLEILAHWKNAEKFGVPANIEKIFPL
ncbi:MAG: hypothetical protein IJY05_03240 [Clostridia bacterium]|nr:hypothetical protein [Clostridia bacterium]